ncbi:MAG: hypothetical protein Q7R90_02815 [bacterium]|nr:hypothetical protein [bacterium]
MDWLQQGLADIKSAQTASFRSRYPIGPKNPIALRDEEIAMVFHVSTPSKGGTMVIDKRGSGTEKLKEMLPRALHPHYDKLRVDSRFDRFVLFAKSHGEGTTNDGMIVGFANDDFYYVVAVWDQIGHDIWEPNPGSGRTPLVKWD